MLQEHLILFHRDKLQLTATIIKENPRTGFLFPFQVEFREYKTRDSLISIHYLGNDKAELFSI